MSEPHIPHYSPDSDKQSKASYIRQLKTHNPQMAAKDIAEKANTSVGYVYNVLSKAKQNGEVERRREDRLLGIIHGGVLYTCTILPSWYNALQAPIVNPRTGMKQVGFSKNHDPCTTQIHKNGTVVVFPHSLGWKEWLREALITCCWDQGKASLLLENLNLQVVLAEAGVKTSEGSLPKEVFLKTAWGMAIIRDDSPTKNMLEVKLSVPDLSRYLGLPEIKKELDLLTQGSMTINQLLRGLTTLLLRGEERQQ